MMDVDCGDPSPASGGGSGGGFTLPSRKGDSISAQDVGALADVRAGEAGAYGGRPGPGGDELGDRRHFFRVGETPRMVGGQGAQLPKPPGLVGGGRKGGRGPLEDR